MVIDFRGERKPARSNKAARAEAQEGLWLVPRLSNRLADVGD